MSKLSVPDKLLSDLVAYRTYAKYIKSLSRRESLPESIERNMQMQLDRFPALTDKIVDAYSYVKRLEIMPSMRGLQFGGPAILRNNIKQYNCAYHPIDRVAAFSETLFLLLSGTGVGYSVQRHHTNQLPKVHKPLDSGYYVVHDSIEGWAEALNQLVSSYFLRKPKPQFDFFQIRAEGSLLETSGGRAPGPDKLREMLALVDQKLEEAIGRRLRPIEVHDLQCIISDCVRAGGIREAALIALFDRDDMEMLTCKSGEWWVDHPYRGRANNSAIMPRDEVTQEEFNSIFEMIKKSGAGEPGLYWTNDKYGYGANPCVEIALRNRQFCNLTTVNQSGIRDAHDLYARVNAATFIGTLQASYTDMPFIDDEWRRVTEEDALIGVSFTGIADAVGIVSDDMLREAASVAVSCNARTASMIGINRAARICTGKPEGSSSAVLAASSGIHGRESDSTYLRRVRLKDNTPLVDFLNVNVPGLMEKSLRDDNAIITIPQVCPPGALSRSSETALDTFHRAIRYNTHWVAPGHISGTNKNNISCTIYVRDNEWDGLRDIMWSDRATYAGLSVLPYDGGTYVQAPFEKCDKATYDRYLSHVKELDFTQIVEYADLTEQVKQIACGGGACELT